MKVNVSKVQQLTGHRGAIFALRKFDDQSFFSSGGDGVIMKWTIGGEQHAEVMGEVPGKVFGLHYIQSSGIMLAATMEGILFVVDTNHKKVINKIVVGDFMLFDVVWLPGMELFVALGGNGVMSLINLEYELVGKIELSKSSLRSLTWHPDLKIFAITSSDHKIYFNSDPPKTDWKVLDGPTHSVFCSTYDHFGKRFFAGSRDACLYVFDVEKEYGLVETINAHMFTINDLVAANPHSIIVSAGRDKHVKVWNSDTLELLKVIDNEKLDGHKHSVNKLLWLEKQSLLISASDDRSLMVWNISVS